ncbi:MAG: Gfo/Idh/MocA family oxidoreductase, partial [Dehalococcoidia bacterium]
MVEEVIRVGLIGAGGNVRNRHIPGFQQVEGLEIAGVANRTLESGRSVADQFNIPQVYSGWQELLEDDSINAVCIGTWPYMHRTLTLAALEKGKHVLTEARMASTAQEARDMLAAAQKHPDLVCQLTPTSTTYKIDNLVKRLIAEGSVGEVLSVEMQALQSRFADFGGELHWRHDWKFSGFNTLNI